MDSVLPLLFQRVATIYAAGQIRQDLVAALTDRGSHILRKSDDGRLGLIVSGIPFISFSLKQSIARGIAASAHVHVQQELIEGQDFHIRRAFPQPGHTFHTGSDDYRLSQRQPHIADSIAAARAHEDGSVRMLEQDGVIDLDDYLWFGSAQATSGEKQISAGPAACAGGRGNAFLRRSVGVSGK